jgi:ribosomal protein S16
MVIPPKKNEKDFDGVTVYDSRDIFKDTFNVVNGIRGDDSRVYHDFHHIGSVIYGAVIFIEYLNEDYGVQRVRLLVSSNLNQRKHGAKEHPHALVTLADTPEKNARIMAKISERSGNYFRGEARMNVVDKPYPNDTIINLDEEKAKALIRSGPTLMDDIAKLLTEKLSHDFDPEQNNFYLFLTFECKNRCGVVSGMVSTDLR